MSILDTVMKKVGSNQGGTQTLHAGEIYSLWEELAARYVSKEKTQLFTQFVEDPDFKIVINTGLRTIEEQINKLERIIEKYSVQAMERPPINVNVDSNISALTDEFIYVEIINGSQKFLDMHTRAYRGSHNDELRELYKKFIIEEIDVYDGLVTYGKIKGWLSKPPQVTPGNV